MQGTLFKIRDKRKKGWFFMDNEYLNGYARIFGAVGTAIYVSLCRHANNETQKCFPSESKIAEELNITDRTVRKYLKWFLEANLIVIEKERDGGRFLNNVYFLVDKTEWIPPEEIVSDGSQRKITAPPEENNSRNQRNVVPTNDTNTKETNKKETKVSSFKKKKKPFFDGQEMRWSQDKWWVIPADGGRWLEFAGEESDIEWR